MSPVKSWPLMAGGPAGEASALMRQRYLVGTKLLETLSRGLFVFVCIYQLPLEEAGKFGLLATVIGLLSFGLGFERYIDMQRQISGRSASAIRRRIADTLRFFSAHYLLVLPLSVLAATQAGFSAWPLILAALVAISEHLANQGYQAVLLNSRAFPLLMAASAKSSLQLLAVIYLFWGEPDAVTIICILEIWAAAAVGYILISSVWWTRWIREPVMPQGDELLTQTVWQQYKASSFHFVIGAVAVAALQIDRLVIAGALTLTDVGVYFRHVTLTSLALQFFNIASFNRVAPSIYQMTRLEGWGRGAQVVKIEYTRFAVLFAGSVILVLVADHLLGNLTRRLELEAIFLIIITAAVLLRTAADYQGLLLLSMGDDKVLLRNQAIAAVVGASGLFLLSWGYQLPGAFLGSVLTPMFYFLLNRLSVKRRYGQLETSLS
jgi:O-antigen/teichoic acid export membrane protein